MENEFAIKNNKKKIAIVMLIIGLLLLGSGVGYYFFTKEILDTNKYLTRVNKILTSYVDNVFNRFDGFVENDLNLDSKSTGNLSFSTNMEDLDILNSYGLDYSLTTSLKKEEIQVYLSLLEDKKDILNGNIYLSKDSLYVNSVDLYNKVLGLNLGSNIFEIINETLEEGIDVADINTIINNLVKYYFEAMKLTDSTSEIIDFTKVKYTYELNENNIESVENKFFELIKNDEKLNELFTDEESIAFETFKVEIVLNVISNKLYSLNILSEDKEIKIINDKEEKDKYTITGLDNKINLYVKKDKIIFKIYEDEELYTLELAYNDKQISIDLIDSNNSINFTLKNPNKDTIGLAVNVNIKDEDEEIIIDVNSEVKKNNNGYTSKVLGDFKMNDEKISFSLNDNTIYGDNLLTNGDFSNFVDINTLTEDDTNLILSNLMKKLEGTKLMDLLSGSSEM